MTGWFARPVLHVTDVEVSLLFYVNRLGFTSPWRYDEDGRAHVAQVDRQGCALITYLYETRQRATGKRELCRFSKPKDDTYPTELELCSRQPLALTHCRLRLRPFMQRRNRRL
jgi:hypothetical protein